MDQSLGYLREFMSGHADDKVGKAIYRMITKNNYSSEGQFVKELSEEEISYLNKLLEDAIEYSKQEQDTERARQLNEVYELLF